MNSVGFVPVKIDSEQDLSIFLSKFPEIKPNEWIKGVSVLYGEVKSGECVIGIEDEKPHRRVDVVAIKCFYTDEVGERYQIFEEKQVFKNGKVRERGNRYVAEKMKPGETPQECAIRGLAEELQIAGPEVKLVSLVEENNCKRGESPTYRGVQCTYNTHYFSCEVPRAQYKETYIEEQEDKSTYFKWIKI